MQAACPQAVFTALGVQSEAFASPFNAISPSFCSASADVDAPFGSCGSFFALEPPAGAVLLANPPFDGATVLAMARRIDELCDAADAADAALASGTAAEGGEAGGLSVAVVVPRTPAEEGWRALKGSRHLRSELVLPRSKHAFVDGGQQYGRRQAPLRLSNHDSSLFWMQSANARADAAALTAARESFRAGFKVLGPLDGVAKKKKNNKKKRGRGEEES